MPDTETVPANQSQPATPSAVNAASRAGASVQGSPADAPALPAQSGECICGSKFDNVGAFIRHNGCPPPPALDPRFLRGDRGSRNKSLARMDAWAEKGAR